MPFCLQGMLTCAYVYLLQVTDIGVFCLIKPFRISWLTYGHNYEKTDHCFGLEYCGLDEHASSRYACRLYALFPLGINLI